MEQVKWFDRKFDFSSQENIFPEILKRLSETPMRIEGIVRMIPEELLSKRLDGKWSIKENIGHLTDLEPLWQQRLEDIVSGAEEMQPADLSNSKTNRANHNFKSVDDLLYDFGAFRNQTLMMLENIDKKIIFKSSLHPRLKTPMRTMDLFLFVAEHDDHHLARISSIEEQLRKVP